MSPSVRLDTATFRQALARFASGVTVLTLRGTDGHDHGMTVTAFTSLSLTPPLVLACIGHEASIAARLADASHVAIHVLSEEQEALSRRFAATETDRFEGLRIRRGLADLPLLDGAIATLQCRIEARHPGGDHLIVVAEVLEAAAADGAPLVYHRGRYGGFRA